MPVAASVVSPTTVVSESAVVVSPTTVVSESTVVVSSTTVVSESTVVVSSTTVGAISSTASTAPARSRCFASIADISEGEIGVLALRTGPIVIVERATLLSLSTTVASESTVVTTSSVVSESTVVISPSPVITPTSLVAPAISSVATSGSVSSVATLLLGLLLCTNRHAHTDEGVHVERTVNMCDMGQGMIGAADDAVHLSDVRAVVRSDHDGVKSGG